MERWITYDCVDSFDSSVEVSTITLNFFPKQLIVRCYLRIKIMKSDGKDSSILLYMTTILWLKTWIKFACEQE